MYIQPETYVPMVRDGKGKYVNGEASRWRWSKYVRGYSVGYGNWVELSRWGWLGVMVRLPFQLPLRK